MARAQGWLIFAGFGWRNLAGRSQSSRLILSSAYFGLPPDWGGYARPWIEAAARCCVGVEELRMKRMVVSDESLELLARSFPRFRALILINCEGFSTDGLAAIASHCKV